MTAAPATAPDISPEFVSALAERAQQAEERRRLPESTVDDFIASARQARLAAAHIVHASRALIGLLLGAIGARGHFLDIPLQRSSVTSPSRPVASCSTTTLAASLPPH